MVYKFRLISDESDDFYRDFEIKDNQTFFDLHSAIQNDLEYDQSQMASFFLSNDKWKKGKEFTLFDPAEEGAKSSAIVMDQATIGEYVKEKRQKILYVYDFLSDRAFYMELVEIKKEIKSVSYPTCTDSNGDAPVQILPEDAKERIGEVEEDFDEFSNEEFPEDFDDEDFVTDETESEDDYFDDGYQESSGYDDYDYR
jgi:hypothetical protein